MTHLAPKTVMKAGELQPINEQQIREGIMYEVMNTQEAAQYLSMSVRNLQELCRKREIPHSKFGKEFRFVRSKLLEWIQGYAQKTKDEVIAGTVMR